MVERRISKEDETVEKPKAEKGQRQRSETGKACQTDKRTDRIRARASYRLFAELYDFIENKSNVADILVKLYDILDARWNFGSIRNAQYAAESLGLVLKDKNGTSERIVGNFYLGESFADVRCLFGHDVRLFNIGRGHYVACDSCRTYIFVGANLMSSWRQENKDIWQENFESTKGYRFLE